MVLWCFLTPQGRVLQGSECIPAVPHPDAPTMGWAGGCDECVHPQLPQRGPSATSVPMGGPSATKPEPLSELYCGCFKVLLIGKKKTRGLMSISAFMKCKSRKIN